MVQLNLLPDVKKEFIRAQRTKGTVISISILVTMGSFGVALILALIVYGAQPGLISVVQGSIDKRAGQLRAVQDVDKYLTIQNQLKALPGLHEGKVAYSRLFDFLKILNPAPPNNVRLTSLQVDEANKKILFTGVTGGFESFSVLLATLRNAEITYKDESGAEVKEKLFAQDGVLIQEQSLTSSEGRQELNFAVEALYQDVIFSPAISNVKLDVPNVQTTQSITGTPGRATAPLFDEATQSGGGR